MSGWGRVVRAAILPGAAFVATLGVHFLWLGLFPDQDPAQSAWAALPPEGPASWLPRYIEAGSFWLGYSYALSVAFAAVALRRYLGNRSCGAGRFAVGGLTFTGLLSVAGCYLVGCCGSPMLVVWLNLLGARFLPFAKPLMAGVTTLSILAAWVWMVRSTSRPVQLTAAPLRR